ncbi:hypothetical protein ACLOJK_031920 [Asimina triloba]
MDCRKFHVRACTSTTTRESSFNFKRSACSNGIRMRPIVPTPAEKKLPPLPESVTKALPPETQFPVDCWFDDDTCILDLDYFVRTLSGIKSRGVRPDLIGAIIVHYASKWLPDINADADADADANVAIPRSPERERESAAPAAAAAHAHWSKKRFFVETLVGILPPDKDSVACNFLLRLLRVANMVGADQGCRLQLERRVASQLDQAMLQELLMPAFSHTCGTLLDVDLVHRLVRMFVELDESVKSGAAIVKVARLVDGYLAEAALDANMTLSQFIALGQALPSYARATDDGLYRAIDTFLKAHPTTSKQEKKTLCKLIDSRKLSPEATFHVAQNERLPVRCVMQLLSSEHAKLNCHVQWSGSLNQMCNPSNTMGPVPGRCPSKREATLQQVEIRKLREDVMRLQSQLYSLQVQMMTLLEKKKGIFRWRKLGEPMFQSAGSGWVERFERAGGDSDLVMDGRTPAQMKAKLVQGKKTPPPKKWANSPC